MFMPKTFIGGSRGASQLKFPFWELNIFHFKKILHKNAFRVFQNWLKLPPVGLKKKFVKFLHNCIFTISLLFPLGKGRGPSFEQNWAPFTQGWVAASWL